MGKKVYQLRLEDFIPIIGLKNHRDRCIYESWRHHNPYKRDFEEYRVKCIGRNWILAMYNIAFVTGTIIGTVDLVNFLSK